MGLVIGGRNGLDLPLELDTVINSGWVLAVAGVAAQLKVDLAAGILWRLAEEPAAAFSPLPRIRGDLRLVIVTGALSDCFGDAALPFRFGAERLRGQGVRVDYVRVSGRSGAEHNARQIADFFAAGEFPPLRADRHARLLQGRR